MIEIERSFRIQRPVEDVFEFMSRFENDAEWRAEISDIRRTAAVGHGIGERYEQMLDVGGRTVPTAFEVTEFENNRHIAWRGTSGDIQAEGSYDFAADGGSTLVDVHAKVMVSAAAQLTEPYISKQLGIRGDEDFRRLRQLLEARA